MVRDHAELQKEDNTNIKKLKKDSLDEALGKFLYHLAVVCIAATPSSQVPNAKGRRKGDATGPASKFALSEIFGKMLILLYPMGA